MLDLWMACRGINLHQAMQEAKAFLGIKDDDHHFDARREKKFSRPDRKKIAHYVTRTESHLEYLQSRGISPEVVKRYEVVSGKVWNGERGLDALVLPYNAMVSCCRSRESAPNVRTGRKSSWQKVTVNPVCSDGRLSMLA